MHRAILYSALLLFALSVGVAAAAKPDSKDAKSYSQPTTDFKVPFPEVDTSALPPELAKEVKRGGYLTRLSDCMACHTDHDEDTIKGKPFAGGLPMKTPFGYIYSRNITPDEKTGIGDWTFEQFDQAVRYGMSPHGYLFAAMPYNYYNVMSREQVHAIWEYLKRVPAVHRKTRSVDMPPPFSWRWLQFGWQFLFFKPGEDGWHYDPQHPYNPDRSAAWNRGHFIVEGPAHCGACHTPHSLLGAPKNSYALAGSGFSGMWAPNIASAVSGVHTTKTITGVFSDARGLAGGKLKGPMLDAITNSLHFMTPEDMHAVAAYIQSVSHAPASGPRPVPPSEVDMSLGQKTYAAECAACHGTGIGGAPKVGNADDWKDTAKEPLFVLYENVWHGLSIMPAKGGCKDCNPRQITSAIVYMLHQSQSGAGKGATTPAHVGGKANAAIPRNVVSLDVGKKIYQAHCAACHANGLMGAPRYGDDSQWAPKLELGLDKLHENALNGIGAMPPKGGCTNCSKDQIMSAVNYIVAGSGGKKMVEQAPQGKD